MLQAGDRTCSKVVPNPRGDFQPRLHAPEDGVTKKNLLPHCQSRALRHRASSRSRSTWVCGRTWQACRTSFDSDLPPSQRKSSTARVERSVHLTLPSNHNYTKEYQWHTGGILGAYFFLYRVVGPPHGPRAGHGSRKSISYNTKNRGVAEDFRAKANLGPKIRNLNRFARPRPHS